MSEHLARAILFRQNHCCGVLEMECRKAAIIVGLEPSVGFLHDFSSYQTKQSLVYDLMEPFRWIGDLATMQAFESGVLDLKDFYFTGDDYRYRIEIEAKRRYLQLMKERFNSGVRYKGKACRWDTVILNKAQDLARYLLEESKEMDFIEPCPNLQRSDTHDVRRGILELTQREAKELSIGKSTLHYLRKNAASDMPFSACKKTACRLVG